MGKTLSARYYANWDKVVAYWSNPNVSERALAEVDGSQTVFYTPEVVNSPRRFEEDIWRWRQGLRLIHMTAIDQEEERLREAIEQRKRVKRYPFLLDLDGTYQLPKAFIEAELTPPEISMIYEKQRMQAPDPTTLLMIDEADRLKTATLELVRDIFDRGGFGVVLIGMPGLEKRISHYPQLYSRVGFVHEFRALRAQEVHNLLHRKWAPSGVTLPKEGLLDEEVLATSIRITGGNFRFRHRLMIQTARLVEINALSKVTREVVEAARETLVIGTA